MSRIVQPVLVGLVLALSAGTTHAVDILSQDAEAHVLTLTLSDGSVEKKEIAAKGELRPICEKGGCIIRMADGQSVEAKSEDIVFIMGGKIEKYEP